MWQQREALPAYCGREIKAVEENTPLIISSGDAHRSRWPVMPRNTEILQVYFCNNDTSDDMTRLAIWPVILMFLFFPSITAVLTLWEFTFMGSLVAFLNIILGYKSLWCIVPTETAVPVCLCPVCCQTVSKIKSLRPSLLSGCRLWAVKKATKWRYSYWMHSKAHVQLATRRLDNKTDMHSKSQRGLTVIFGISKVL